MNKIILILTIVLSLTSFARAQTGKKEGFNPDGGIFYVSSDTKKPKALANFEGMAITTHDYKPHDRVISIKPNGVVYEKGDRQLKMTKVFFDGDSFSFETVARNGVSYQFNGEILKSPQYNSDGQEIVLQGHLIKFVGGKKTAEADFRFQFEEGG